MLNFLKNIFRSDRGETTFGINSVLPKIKHLNFLSGIEHHLKQIEAGDIKRQMPITKPFVGDLIISYAFETPEHFVSVTPPLMSDAGLKADSLHEIAMQNLEATLSDKINIQDLLMYNAIVTGNHLEASTLLLSGLWEMLAAGCIGDLLMVVPTRDSVLFMDSGNDLQLTDASLNSKQMLNLMCAAALDSRDEQQIHSLSEYVFAWNGDWEIRGTLDDHVRS